MSVSTDRRVQLLQGVSLFADLGEPALTSIAEVAIEVDFPAGRAIVRQDEVGTGFYLIAGGRARVVRDGETVAELGPGQFFGELSLLDGRPRIATVSAIEPTTCLAIASWDFETLLQAQPGVAIAILRGVAQRLREVIDESARRLATGG
ncbi:MAG: cyclic nucleotide-binding domain-containing protein [Candidatus Limnocylindrales bacterium]